MGSGSFVYIRMLAYKSLSMNNSTLDYYKTILIDFVRILKT